MIKLKASMHSFRGSKEEFSFWSVKMLWIPVVEDIVITKKVTKLVQVVQLQCWVKKRDKYIYNTSTEFFLYKVYC